jgi:hypothetical protein
MLKCKSKNSKAKLYDDQQNMIEDWPKSGRIEFRNV